MVYMAWGTPAGKRVAKIDQKRHLVLKSVHPSPLSASRGFFDCGHFKKANEWLRVTYGTDAEIDWSLGPHTTSTTAAGMEGAGKAKSQESYDDLDALEAEAFAAVAEGQSKVNVMGPPPTPSPRKGDRVTTPVKSQGCVGKENEKVDLPA